MRVGAAMVAMAVLSGCYLSHERSVDGPDGCVEEACEVVADLDGLRWELPCLGETEWPEVCATEEALSVRTRLRGAPGAIYEVDLRFRGVVETKEYAGGSGPPPLNRGGMPDGSAWNLYALRVSRPASRVFLNDGPTGRYQCVPIDSTTTVRMASGALVTLEAEVFDARQIRNRTEAGTPIVVAGVPPDPEPYDGQFIQMDVVGIRRAR